MVVEQWVVEVEGWKAGFLALRRSRHYADTNGNDADRSMINYVIAVL
jgi:hypothetical protein